MVGITLLTILAALAASTSGSGEKGAFETLAVTLPDPTRPLTARYWFNTLPTTLKEAEKQNWSKSPQDLSCADPAKFYVGNRFVPPYEPSVAILLDSQGVVAGLQAIYDVESLVSGSAQRDCKTLNKYVNDYKFQDQPMLNTEVIDGKEKYVLTVYFDNPKEICTSTRDPASVKDSGYGTGLYFQNGPTPDTLLVAPPTRPEAAAQNWDNNKCLPLNGYHNFLHSSQWDSQNCTEIVPNWLFYDENNKLTGGGFSIPGCDPSPRFQHPP
ncbi:unnamed protein product, partial [Allacma fusca]